MIVTTMVIVPIVLTRTNVINKTKRFSLGRTFFIALAYYFFSSNSMSILL